MTQPNTPWLTSLAQPTSASTLGFSMLAQDMLFGRIAKEAAPALVDCALKDGQAWAAYAAEQWGSNPLAIAAYLGVPVVESDADAGFGSTLVCAEYSGWPVCITLYRPAIAHLNRRVAASSLKLCIEDCGPVFLAHELYHHLDGTAHPPLRERHRITLFQLARWRWTGTLSSLEEIAAGAFAQTLLGLSFHPKLLDLV